MSDQIDRVLVCIPTYNARENLPLVDVSMLTSLVSVVVAIAFLAGVCYGIVAISAQVQLQEDIPAEGLDEAQAPAEGPPPSLPGVPPFTFIPQVPPTSP